MLRFYQGERKVEILASLERADIGNSIGLRSTQLIALLFRARQPCPA
jgi:hypothetical protein